MPDPAAPEYSFRAIRGAGRDGSIGGLAAGWSPYRAPRQVPQQRRTHADIDTHAIGP